MIFRRRGIAVGIVAVCAAVAVLVAVLGMRAGASPATVANETTRMQVSAHARQPSRTYRAEVLADKPVAYWRLGDSGDDLVDETGANPGKYEGDVELGRPGALRRAANDAAAFDGTDDHAVVADSSSLDATRGVSVEAWLRRAKSSDWQVVVGKPGDGNSARENYGIWINTLNQVVAYFGNGRRYVSVAADLDKRWHHVVATYDNETASLYLDGVLVAEAASTLRLTPNDDALNIGRSSGNSTFFGGRLDDIAVYRSVLTPSRVLVHYRRGRAIDAVPPRVALRAQSNSSGARLYGVGADGRGDAPSIVVWLWRGRDAVGRGSRRLTARRDGRSFSLRVKLPVGVYTARAEQRDAVGSLGYSRPLSFGVGRSTPPAGRELVAAGDIASCSEAGATATGSLLDRFPSAVVATLGDNAYSEGTRQQFSECYEPTWGRALNRTRPALGDHDYGDRPGGSPSGYFAYFRRQLAPFGPAASDRRRGYYSYDLGAWHVVVLNGLCHTYARGCSPVGQERWLRRDLASHRSACTLAILHGPLFTSGSVHDGDPKLRPYWNALYDHGAELVLSGNNHNYERFAPQDPRGRRDPRGIRQFVVGTGGAGHYGFARIQPNSQVRNGDAYGVLRLTLRPARYEWQFVSEPGKTFTDAGEQRCHLAPAA